MYSMKKTNKKITIGNIYRHPKNNNSNPTIENSIQQINPIIFKLSKENSYAIFTGDFNINLLEMNTRIKYQAYFDQFVTNGFYSKIVQPCRFTKRTGSVIDQTFCKLSEEIILWYTHWHFVWSSTTFYLPWYVIKSTETTKIYNKRKHDGNSLLLFYNEIEISQKYSFSKWTNNRPKCDIQSIRKKYIVCHGEAPETCEDQIESL